MKSFWKFQKENLSVFFSKDGAGDRNEDRVEARGGGQDLPDHPIRAHGAVPAVPRPNGRRAAGRAAREPGRERRRSRPLHDQREGQRVAPSRLVRRKGRPGPREDYLQGLRKHAGVQVSDVEKSSVHLYQVFAKFEKG